ncbi:MAG: 50S ribosomal protein L21 [Thermodesulfobacteriota bacteirum]|jgi:large subunit ribosomal protein L21|nr:50S ribosomal protein L21 [Thermodesulfobacteriota bacterium]
MEAVIKTGGKQYLIKEGDKIQIEKTAHEVGAEIGFDEILYISDEKNVLVNAAQLKTFKIKAKVLSDDKGKKLKVFKFRRRKNSKTLNGHRQPYQTVEILSISK